MSFLLKWLRIEKSRHVSLHPHRALEFDEPPEALFDRTLEGIDRVLGGVVRESDRARGTIEATFGLTFSERLTCSFEATGEGRTRVRIAGRRGALPQATERSDYVERLAEFLERGR
ncbi:MAG: hypothetical protein ACYDG0_00045 [Vulcanimicrobiaceae bacterium]